MSLYQVGTKLGYFKVSTRTGELKIKRNNVEFSIDVMPAISNTGKHCLLHSYWKKDWHPQRRIFGERDCFIVFSVKGDVLSKSCYQDEAFSEAEKKL